MKILLASLLLLSLLPADALAAQSASPKKTQGAFSASKPGQNRLYAIPYKSHRDQPQTRASNLPDARRTHYFVPPLPQSGHNYMLTYPQSPRKTKHEREHEQKAQ